MGFKVNLVQSNAFSTLILGERGIFWPCHQILNIFWNWLSVWKTKLKWAAQEKKKGETQKLKLKNITNVFCGLQCIIVHYLSHCWYLGKKNSRFKETIKRHYFRNIRCCMEILRQIINKTKRIIKLNVCKKNFYLTSTILIEGMEEIPECQYWFAVMDYFGEN